MARLEHENPHGIEIEYIKTGKPDYPSRAIRATDFALLIKGAFSDGGLQHRKYEEAIQLLRNHEKKPSLEFDCFNPFKEYTPLQLAYHSVDLIPLDRATKLFTSNRNGRLSGEEILARLEKEAKEMSNMDEYIASYVPYYALTGEYPNGEQYSCRPRDGPEQIIREYKRPLNFEPLDEYLDWCQKVLRIAGEDIRKGLEFVMKKGHPIRQAVGEVESNGEPVMIVYRPKVDYHFSDAGFKKKIIAGARGFMSRDED
jgi:hypothetical protein